MIETEIPTQEETGLINNHEENNAMTFELMAKEETKEIETKTTFLETAKQVWKNHYGKLSGVCVLILITIIASVKVDDGDVDSCGFPPPAQDDDDAKVQLYKILYRKIYHHWQYYREAEDQDDEGKKEGE